MSKKSLVFTFATLVFFAGCEVPFDLDFSSEEVTEESDEESTGFIDEEELSGIQWSTYTSEEFGFSVDFPSTWSAEEDAQGRPFVSFTSPERTGESEGDQMIKIDAQIKVYSGAEDLPNNSEGLSFEEWVETENSYFDGQPNQTKVDGFSGYLMKSKGFANIESEFIMLEHEGKVYELNFNVPDANDYEEERQGMLESFQFLSSSSNETSATVSGSCDEEACFMENFKTCETATLSTDIGFSGGYYEILGASENGCDVKMVYTKNPNPAWVDQALYCTLDMDLDFLTAFQAEFEAAVEGEGTCTGPLAEVLQDL